MLRIQETRRFAFDPPRPNCPILKVNRTEQSFCAHGWKSVHGFFIISAVIVSSLVSAQQSTANFTGAASFREGRPEKNYKLWVEIDSAREMYQTAVGAHPDQSESPPLLGHSRLTMVSTSRGIERYHDDGFPTSSEGLGRVRVNAYHLYCRYVVVVLSLMEHL